MRMTVDFLYRHYCDEEGCDNTSPPARYLPHADDLASAEGWEVRLLPGGGQPLDYCPRHRRSDGKH